MSKPRNPIAGLIAAILLSEVMAKSEKQPPDLAAMFAKGCGDPACPACNAQHGESPEMTVVHDAVEIPADIAELVGITPSTDHDSLVGRTRALAAAFLVNIRALREQPESDFQKAGAKMMGIQHAENSVLPALHAVASLAK